MDSNSKVYSFDEVAKHNHQKDCWLIISGYVCSSISLFFFLKSFSNYNTYSLLLLHHLKDFDYEKHAEVSSV